MLGDLSGELVKKPSGLAQQWRGGLERRADKSSFEFKSDYVRVASALTDCWNFHLFIVSSFPSIHFHYIPSSSAPPLTFYRVELRFLPKDDKNGE